MVVVVVVVTIQEVFSGQLVDTVEQPVIVLCWAEVLTKQQAVRPTP